MENKLRLDIMCDIETLGKDSDTAIFQIAAAAFDIETGSIMYRFNEICNISNTKILVDGDTLKWWLNTDKELLTKLLNQGNCSEKWMVEKFHDWITELQKTHEVYFWGNGILFDNRLVKEKMASYGLQYPIFYRNDRDLRTLVEMASIKYDIDPHNACKVENPEKHNAMFDVEHQIRVATYCWHLLMAKTYVAD